MAEKGEVSESQEVVAKPSRKTGRKPGRVATTIAGVVGGVIAAGSALPGINPEGIGSASAQGRTPEPARSTATLPPTREVPRTPTSPPKSPTTSPDVITVPRDVYNQSIENSVQGRLAVERTAIAKQPSPTPVVKYIERQESGGGGGLGLLDTPVKLLLGAIGLLFGAGNSERVGRVATRIADRLRIRRTPSS